MYPSWGCGNEEVRAPGVLSPRLLLSRIKARSLTAQTAPNHPLPFPLPTPSTTPLQVSMAPTARCLLALMASPAS